MGHLNFFDTKELVRLSASGAFLKDRELLALLRCVIALLALSLIVARFSWQGTPFKVVAFYMAFSCCFPFIWSNKLQPSQDRIYCCVDITFLTYWLAVLKLYESPFFVFFLFPVIVAARLNGAREGWYVLVIAASVHGSTAWLMAIDPLHNLSDSLSRTFSLLLLGGAVILWAASEEVARDRLRFLIETNDMWNPRLGTEAMVLRNLKKLAEFYQADQAIAIMNLSNAPGKWKIYSTQAAGRARTIPINEAAAAKLVALPRDIVAAFNNPNHSWMHRIRGYVEFRVRNYRCTRRCGGSYYSACQDILNILDTSAFATAPYTQGEGISGRIYLTSAINSYSAVDAAFLLQVSRVLALGIENTFLAEQLIAHAGHLERQRMSRDLHDMSIQPYIGLKLALEALQREAAGTAIARRIDEIVQMTGATIIDLRTHASQLRNGMSFPGQNLAMAIDKHADTYQRFFGIKVEVRNNIEAAVNGEVAAEVLQMLSEGLSNVLRHTAAKRAFVDISADVERISLKIGNEVPSIHPDDDTYNASHRPIFTPKSITERASSLGGTVMVAQDSKGFTVVCVEIPNVLSYE